MALVRYKLHSTAFALRSWNKNVFGFCQTKINELEDRIQWLQGLEPTEESLSEERRTQWELEEWRKRVEILWRQKSRELWLTAGDKNSKFFHVATIANRRKIFIHALKDANGHWKETREDIGALFINEFTKLFEVENLRRSERLAEFIHYCVSYDENVLLEAISTKRKIWNVVKDMPLTKAPGPDGMPALFFQTYWNIVGPDVVTMIQNVFRSGMILRDINRSFVVLIPKVHGVLEFKHLRPISLCNTVYKIIMKIIVDRLRPILRKIISPNQSTFVPGRWMGETTLMVNKVIHAMKKHKGIKVIVGIKMDLQKAYDKVDWIVLTKLLILFGFSEKFTKLVLNYIFSVSMELLLNGSIFGRIPMERGLR